MTLMKAMLFAVILVFVLGLILMLPTVTINKEAVTTSAAYQWIRAGLYFIPTAAIVSICSMQLVLWSFRVIIALIKVIWDVLPL